MSIEKNVSYEAEVTQVAAQHQSNSAKETHKLLSNLDDQIKEKEYADLAKERLDDSTDNYNRLVGINREGIALTLCRPCVEQKLETLEKDSIIDFEKFFVKHESTMSPSRIFAAYKLKQKKE